MVALKKQANMSKPKPRLSMKLMWAMLVEYQDTHDNPSMAGAFLKWVEEQLKPLKISSPHS